MPANIMSLKREETTLPGEFDQGDYCAVLQSADRSLWHVIGNENIAGLNVDAVVNVMLQLVKCLQHMHSEGITTVLEP